MCVLQENNAGAQKVIELHYKYAIPYHCCYLYEH